MSIEGEPDSKVSGYWFRPAMYIFFVMLVLAAGVWGYLRTSQEMPGTESLVKSFDQARPQTPLEQPLPPPVDTPPDTPADVTVDAPVNMPVNVSVDAPVNPPVNPQVNLKPQPLVTLQETPKNASHVNQDLLQQPIQMNELALIDKWVCLPMGVEQIGLINIDKSSLLMIKKQDGKLVKSEQISLDWPYPQGVYMAGYAARKQGFIFHPEFSYLKKMSINNPEFWKIIKSGTQNIITPIIALKYTTGLAKGPEYSADTVQKRVIDWGCNLAFHGS